MGLLTRNGRTRFTVAVDRETLLALSKDDLVTLILAQQAQIEALTVQVQTLTARITELEARLNAPAKTPDNSSMPPAKGQKPNRPPLPAAAVVGERPVELDRGDAPPWGRNCQSRACQKSSG